MKTQEIVHVKVNWFDATGVGQCSAPVVIMKDGGGDAMVYAVLPGGVRISLGYASESDKADMRSVASKAHESGNHYAGRFSAIHYGNEEDVEAVKRDVLARL